MGARAGFWRDLAPQPAPVEGQKGAGDKVPRRGSEQHDGPLEVLGLPVAAGGDAGEEGRAAFLVLADRARKLRGVVARGYGVDVYAQRRPLVGEGAREVRDAGLGGGVGGDGDAALVGEDGGGAYDLAPAALLHE